MLTYADVISIFLSQCDLVPEEFHLHKDLPPLIYYRLLPSGETEVTYADVC
jgi:hypothetical protein